MSKIIDVDFMEKRKHFTYDDAVQKQSHDTLFNKLADCVIWAREIESDPNEVHLFSMKLWAAFELLKRKVQ